MYIFIYITGHIFIIYIAIFVIKFFKRIKRYYIQSAYEIPNNEKWQQEIRPFDKTNDSFKKIVIVEKSMKPRRDDKGYLMMGVKEFLLDSDSLEL